MEPAIPEGEFLLRLFPLPTLVFFPSTRLPLHVFEPRYRQLVADALATDERIGMILLRPGWEEDYYGAPPVHRVGTMGTIEQVVELGDGRYNLLLRGEVRFRILAEPDLEPYRTARVIASPEGGSPPMDALARREWLAELARGYIELLPGQMSVPELDSASLESLVNALVMSLDLDPQQKQQLLELDQILTRAERVGHLLQQRLEMARFLRPYRKDSDPEMN